MSKGPNDTISSSAAYQSGAFVFDMFMTMSPVMTQCLRLAEAAAGNDLAVLITGETGTGKNLIAQAIHNASSRKDGESVVVNCGALSESLVEAELFGHEKGAFTGAAESSKGRFELAAGGTLVLDEIGDMSPSAQTKILHAVEYKQFHRVGGQKMVSVDVRVIALTNRPLEKLVAQGHFRQDLLYRLKELHIEIPPLRNRPEDIPLLCQRFLSECRLKLGKDLEGFGPKGLAALKAHQWSGNCRELKATIRSAAMLATGTTIDAQDILSLIGARETPDPAQSGELSLRTAERRQIERALGTTHGNKRRASEMLGISRPTLDKKIREYGIDVK